MRTVSALALVTALSAPAAATAATNPADIQSMLVAYQGVQSVRVIERFENGHIATVDVLPAGQYRVAETGGEDPALVLHIATAPVDGARWDGTYAVKPLGKKTIEGVPAAGYQVSSPDQSFVETVWISQKTHLPISSQVATQGHQIDVTYGDYNNTTLVARP